MSKGQKRFKPQTNPKCTPQSPEDQDILDIGCQVQWEIQGKTCGRWFSHSRSHREHLLRSSVPETLKTCHTPWGAHNLDLWGADIGNSYLDAYTHEKLFIIVGAEFEELQGFILIFNKALHGLKSVEKGGQKGSMTSSRTWASCLPKQTYVCG